MMGVRRILSGMAESEEFRVVLTRAQVETAIIDMHFAGSKLRSPLRASRARAETLRQLRALLAEGGE